MSDASEYDDQDQSEMFDEDRINPEDSGSGPDMLTFEELPQVYDATTALGDADEDDVALDADEIDDDDLDDIGDDADDDEVFDDDDEQDDTLDDDLEDDPEDDEIIDDEDDLDEVDGVNEVEDDEAELEYVEDTDAVAGAAPTRARVMESSGELSDADLEELGYQGEDAEEEEQDEIESKERHMDQETGPAQGHSGEEKHAATPAAATVEDADMDALNTDERQDRLLDEGVEETFPASDPISVKRIT